MRQPTKPKPQAFEEVARVMNIARMLREEIFADASLRSIAGDWDILAVAERIAARTEG